MEIKEAYLDNSATTKVFDSAAQIVLKTMKEDFGNTSSLHLKGVTAENYIKEARSNIAKEMKINEKELIFTSGGTESNNMALIGAAMANQRRGKHLITTSVEHASVSKAMEFLESQGFSISKLSVDENGLICLDELKELLRNDTIIVSIIYVNNEIGSVQPLEEISKLIKGKNPQTLLHVDAIQAFGKYRIYPKKMGIDMMSVSAHKIHGPKGVGFLYVREGVKINPIIWGGGHQNGLRSGTENVPGVAGLGAAVKEIYEGHDEKIARLYKLKRYFIQGVESLPGTTVNGKKDEKSAPHIVSVSFEGVKSEVLLHSLEERKIYVSSGSACSSNHNAVSETLKNIGVKKELLDSTLRFSFSVYTSQEELDYCLAVLQEILPMLRRYQRS